jgi:hypothetical protein
LRVSLLVGALAGALTATAADLPRPWKGTRAAIDYGPSCPQIAFPRHGTPNAPGLPAWPAFDSRYRATMIFDVVSRAVNDPLRDERLLLPQAPP